jgi:hypothetical protein
MRSVRPFIGLALLVGLLIPLRADPRDGEIVRGRHFEGVIFTPGMIHADATMVDFYGDPGGLWTPSRALVLQVEAALPAVIAEKTKYGKPPRGPNFPRFFTPKNAMRPNYTGDPHLVNDDEDSVIESNFLFLVRSYYDKQKRQYIGVTIRGKRLLLVSFIYGPGIYHDQTMDQWKHLWIEVLDGGDNFWRVLYDPATGKFSGWECNGYA